MKCAHCGKEFEPHNSWQKYCSYKCKAQAQWKRNRDARRARFEAARYKCRYCGKEFKPLHLNQRFCSKECWALNRKKNAFVKAGLIGSRPNNN